MDWFKLVVPEDGTRVEIRTAAESWCSHYLYRGQDFLTAGDNAADIGQWRESSNAVRTLTLDAGTYYLKVTDGRVENCSVVYNILPPSEENVSLETAKPLAPGEWAEYYKNADDSGIEYRCFSIGERKAGEVVRVSRDAAGRSCYVSLLDAAGETVKVMTMQTRPSAFRRMAATISRLRHSGRRTTTEDSAPTACAMISAAGKKR